jgi:hypothetical protein
MVPLAIVRFCAVECELQRSGERSVFWMIAGFLYAQAAETTHDDGLPLEEDVLALGGYIEPEKNRDGYRTVGVRVGYDLKPHPAEVPGLMKGLMELTSPIMAEEWFRQYEEIHPFRDGNGRTGQILYNWIRSSLDAPVWAPDFWADPRRRPGEGAPEV